jgi:hypothetical protein
LGVGFTPDILSIRADDAAVERSVDFVGGSAAGQGAAEVGAERKSVSWVDCGST